MSFEAAAGDSSNLLTGIFMLLLVLSPVLMVYCIRNLITPKVPAKVLPPAVPEMARFKKFRPKVVRLCPMHIVALHKKGMCLLDSDNCAVCKALKK